MVDDSEAELRLITRFLHSVRDFSLIGTLRDGAEAVSYLRGTSGFDDCTKFPYPDLLLLDYEMPRTNGIEVLKSLTLEKVRPRVILWSNAPERINQELAKQLGADLVCRKPSNALELKAIFNKLSWPAAVSSAFHHRRLDA